MAVGTKDFRHMNREDIRMLELEHHQENCLKRSSRTGQMKPYYKKILFRFRMVLENQIWLKPTTLLGHPPSFC